MERAQYQMTILLLLLLYSFGIYWVALAEYSLMSMVSLIFQVFVSFSIEKVSHPQQKG